MAVRGEILRVGGHDVKITRPEKILFPEDGITKRDLIDYYRRVAPWILPHLRDRPLALERYPDGIDKPGFFQKATPFYYPGWIKTVTIKKKTGGTVRHVVCNNVATLVYLANQACLTPHIWLSRIDKLDYPDQLVFDLDPSGDKFEPVKVAAQSLKELLDQLGLPAYLKTTGGRGLHVAVPLKRSETFDSVRAFATALAKIVVRQEPGQLTLEQRKNRRRGRVFVDTNRNAYAQTVAPAYAVRPRRGAPVSVPLDWDDLGRKDLRSDGVTIRNLFSRLEAVGDPWRDFWRRGASLNHARQKLEKLNAARRVPQEEEVY
ncbi:MAG TPA: non-homologous end-joining DNA ligase [Candidatus Binatia bacterium]|nr:non-homologous end-joining DNA ligase [Candidatus Binatia bacterium]